MKKQTVFIPLLISLGVTACSTINPPQPTPTLTASAPAKTIRTTGSVIAEGRVVPVRSAVLSFQSAGIIAEAPVAVGASVKAGDVLARLDISQLNLQLAHAEAKLAAAQAASDRLTIFDQNELIALKSDVEKTKALVNRAQAAYDRIGGDFNPASGTTMERANLQTAWQDYEKALALYRSKINPPATLLQQAKAEIDAARAARDLVNEQIKGARVIAPFAGTVTSGDLKVGEYVAAGTPVLRLADTSAWQIETTDLTELNIVNIKEGDPVTMTFDAIPGLESSGKVSLIKSFGENRQGDIVYTVVVTPDMMDARWRWNMTAKVNIESK